MQRLYFIAHITLWEMIFCYCNSKKNPTNINVLKNVKGSFNKFNLIQTFCIKGWRHPEMTFAQVSPGYSCDPILSRRQREYNFSFIFPLKILTLLNQQRKQATGMSIYDNSSYKISCVIGYLRLTLRRNVRISIGLKVASHVDGSWNVFSSGFSPGK